MKNPAKIKVLAQTLLAGFFLALFLSVPLTFAQTNFSPPTLLPGENADLGGYGDACIGLADSIRSGQIHLRQIPCFIKYFAKTLIAIAGSLSVIFVMIGGYKYVLPTEEDKASAKKTITYALIGLAVSLLAWVLVDIVLQVITE